MIEIMSDQLDEIALDKRKLINILIPAMTSPIISFLTSDTNMPINITYKAIAILSQIICGITEINKLPNKVPPTQDA